MQNCGLQRRARNPIKKNNRIWHSHFTPLPGQPCGADFYHFWRVGSYRRRNHPCQILGRLVKWLGGYSYPKSGVSHWLWMSLLQQCYALTCYTVMIHFCTEQQTLQAWEQNWLNSSWSHFARNTNAMIRRQSESTLVHPVLFWTKMSFRLKQKLQCLILQNIQFFVDRWYYH